MKIEVSAKAIVVSPSGKFLVLIGSEWKERPDRSLQPDLPGGAIEDDETLEQGLIREIREESGFDVDRKNLQLLFATTTITPDGNTSLTRLIYMVKTIHDRVTLSWEHSDYKWLDKDDFLGTAWRPVYKEALVYLDSNKLL